jgi:cold shock CspA family protein
MPYGHITRVEPALGFGWLVDEAGIDYFFVREGVRAGVFERLTKGEHVTFDSEGAARLQHQVRVSARSRVSLLLFDIDGTLLLSGGAGIRAMTRAFEDVFAVREAFAGSDVAGRTDRFIVSGALIRAGLPDTPEQHHLFREAYVPLLREEILKPATGRYGLMPGIQALLDRLRHRGSVHFVWGRINRTRRTCAHRASSGRGARLAGPCARAKRGDWRHPARRRLCPRDRVARPRGGDRQLQREGAACLGRRGDLAGPFRH